MRRSRSVAVTTTNVPHAIAAAAVLAEIPKSSTQPTSRSAVASSIARSRGGMRTPQRRQRPRSSAYESTGTLSYQLIGVSQLMHAEPGRTIERRSGTRAATTPRKLPRARPGTNTSGRTRITLSLSTSARGRVSGGLQRLSRKHRRQSPAARLVRALVVVVLGGQPDQAGAVGRAVLRLAELGALAGRQPKGDRRRARVEHVRAGLRRLRDDDVRRVAADRSADLPAEAAVLEHARSEHEHLVLHVRHDLHLHRPRRVRLRRLHRRRLACGKADRRAHQQDGSGDGRDAREREDTPGHGSCIGRWEHAHDPLMGEVDDVGGECGAGRARLEAVEGGADDSLRAVVVRGVPPVAEAVDADERARVRRVDEVAVPDVDPDVVEPVEEHEVAGLELVARHRDGVRRVPLGHRVVRQRDAELPEDVLDEAGAVEAGIRAPAGPFVRDPEVLQRDRDDAAVLPGRREAAVHRAREKLARRGLLLQLRELRGRAAETRAELGQPSLDVVAPRTEQDGPLVRLELPREPAGGGRRTEGPSLGATEPESLGAGGRDLRLPRRDLVANRRHLRLQRTPRREERGCRGEAVTPALGVHGREPEDVVHVRRRVVVAVHGALDVELSAAAGEVAGGAEDRVRGVVRIGDSVAVRVHSPAGPGRGHELHPPDRPGRARPQVLAEVRLDLVDRGEHLPRDPVRAAGRLPDAAQGGEGHRPRAAGRLGERDDAAARVERRRGSAGRPVLPRDAERVRGGGARDGEAKNERGPEEGGQTLHGYCWPATRSLGSSWLASAVPFAAGSGSGSDAGSSSGSGSGTESSCPWAARACSLMARSSAMRKSCRFEAALAAISRSTFSSSTSWISAFENVCIWKKSPSAIASVISSGLLSRMRSAMRAFAIITSTAGTRPPPTRGSRRWLTTPRSTPARIDRMSCCLTAGKNSTIRPIVSEASTVCIVESTR